MQACEEDELCAAGVKLGVALLQRGHLLGAAALHRVDERLDHPQGRWVGG